jgi:uncharacterized protein
MSNKNLILKGLVGSHAYGYARPDSDLDWMSVYTGSIETYFGLSSVTTIHSVSEEVDNTDFEFLKFVKLCVNFNPNVIPLLFLKEYHPDTNNFGYELVNNRDLFVTKRAYQSLMGYAVSQEKKSKHGITEKFGQKRKELVAQYGYDVKSAAHTIRLLVLAKVLFETGEVILESAAEECVKYRSGIYSAEEFQERFKELKEQVESSYKKSNLPETHDITRVNEFCVNLLKKIFTI